MNQNVFAVLSTVLLLSACTNPINRVTSDNYADTCVIAEKNRQLVVAEQACYRALVNVDIGNLGDELKSQRLYNLARIKRQLSKFSEAQQLLDQSLAIEESLSGASSLKTGRRLVELSVSLAGQSKWLEGSTSLSRAMPIADQFTGQDRAYTKEALTEFAKQLRKIDQNQLAEVFEEKAKKL
jgi:hypothetical protein